MEIERHSGMVANQYIRMGSNSCEKVKTFKYLGSLVTNQNSIHDEIKYRKQLYRMLCYMVVKHGLLH